jgi:acetyltransferase-like isoleucine patch superfamily enzyme
MSYSYNKGMRFPQINFGKIRLRKSLFVHPWAICESKNIGKGTRIWAFSHILPLAEIGQNCNICENVFIENKVSIGNNVTIKNGVQIWDGISLEDNVFVGPNVTFCNDKFPRSGNREFKLLITRIKLGASIGANSTILPGIEVGQYAIVGAGSVVTKNVGDYQVVAGNPARPISENRVKI